MVLITVVKTSTFVYDDIITTNVPESSGKAMWQHELQLLISDTTWKRLLKLVNVITLSTKLRLFNYTDYLIVKL